MQDKDIRNKIILHNYKIKFYDLYNNYIYQSSSFSRVYTKQ
jgi:hypothetical protein